MDTVYIMKNDDDFANEWAFKTAIVAAVIILLIYAIWGDI